MNSQIVSKYCIGRFRFQLPESLIITGRSQSIYDVDIDTVPIPAGGVKALWDDRLKKIRALVPPQGVAEPMVRSFEIQPGVRAAWYFNNPYNSNIREIAALKQYDNYAVSIVTGGEAGKEPLIERLVTNVLNAYTSFDDRGFCVGEGSVSSEPGDDERTFLSLSHMNVDEFKLTFSTQTVQQPDTKTYSDLEEEKRMLGDQGRMSILREGSRSVAGISGKEIWVSVTLPDKPPFLRFTWHFPGVPQNASQPSINIKATAPSANRAELEQAWDTLLQSLRSVPVGK